MQETGHLSPKMCYLSKLERIWDCCLYFWLVCVSNNEIEMPKMLSKKLGSFDSYDLPSNHNMPEAVVWQSWHLKGMDEPCLVNVVCLKFHARQLIVNSNENGGNNLYVLYRCCDQLGPSCSKKAILAVGVYWQLYKHCPYILTRPMAEGYSLSDHLKFYHQCMMIIQIPQIFFDQKQFLTGICTYMKTKSKCCSKTLITLVDFL